MFFFVGGRNPAAVGAGVAVVAVVVVVVVAVAVAVAVVCPEVSKPGSTHPRTFWEVHLFHSCYFHTKRMRHWGKDVSRKGRGFPLVRYRFAGDPRWEIWWTSDTSRLPSSPIGSRKRPPPQTNGWHLKMGGGTQFFINKNPSFQGWFLLKPIIVRVPAVSVAGG